MNAIKTELFKQILSSHNLRPFVLLKDYSNLAQADHEFRMRLYENFLYEDIIRFLDRFLKPGQIMTAIDSFQIHSFFFQIPEPFLLDYQAPLFFSGPFLTKRLTSGEVREIMRQKDLPAAMFKELITYYNTLPVFSMSEDWDQYLENLVSGFFESDYQVIPVSENDRAFPSFPKAENHKLREAPKIAESSIEERYRYENRLLDLIRQGNYHEARQCFKLLRSICFIPPRTENRLRNEQNMMIVLSTLFRKTVEQSGVPPVYIDELSSRFAVQINEARSVKELEELSFDMLHRYCLLVQNNSMKGYSLVVRKVVTYIDFHYAEDLSLNFFAEQNSITKTYLSGLFKKEVGMTLTDYLHSVRMRQALILIHSGSIPMSVVAASCGYNDMNYFIRVFKKNYGMTPKQYRQTVKS